MVAASPVYDSGAIAGRVEIRRSQRALMVMTAMIAVLAASLGAIAFAALRLVPLRLLQRALARSTHLATHDSLTGLPNRALFLDRLEQSVAWSRRESASVAVLYLDLDRFKEVNDTLGHAAVSPVQFRRPGFIEQVQGALHLARLDPARLEVEITEGVLLNETEETLGTLRRLRSIGVAVAMDDFGIGYSSLGYLQKFRFDKLKIDRSFVRNLGTDAHAAEIVRAVVRMSHAMGIRVNAEGVEHEEQASLLHDEGCEEVQGFLFSKAVTAAVVGNLLARGPPQRFDDDSVAVAAQRQPRAAPA